MLELLAIIFVWPFIFFALGLAFVALSDSSGGGVPSFSWLWVVLALAVVYFLLRHWRKTGKVEWSTAKQLEVFRKGMVIVSIALLLPVFTRYLYASFQESLVTILFGLLLGFAFTVWGFFVENNHVLKYANVIGGGLTLVFVYSKLWDLGDAARVYAAGFGLLLAVVIAAVKLKDKLT